MRGLPSGFAESGARRPVERVPWRFAQEPIRRLNEREPGSGLVCRSPPEAARADMPGGTGTWPESRGTIPTAVRTCVQ